jgi:hypothetical protein
MDNFIGEAKTQWDGIATIFQEKIINNVWCPHCGTKTTITKFGGTMLMKSLILRGFCITCDKPVARVLEGHTQQQL